MSIPLNWLVLFFFIILVVVFFLVYEINSKFEWRVKAFSLEDEIQKLKKQISDPTNLKEEFNIAINDIKEKLSLRQYQIFIHTIEGYSSKEIAKILHISPNTIDTHIKEIIKNLNVKKRSQLAGVFINKLGTRLNISLLRED